MDMFIASFSGRLAKDAEIKVSKKGSNYVSLIVMSNFEFDRSSGSNVGHAVQLAAFGSEAKFASKLKKGDKVFVTARLETVNIWQSKKDGQWRPYLNATVVAIQGASAPAQPFVAQTAPQAQPFTAQPASQVQPAAQTAPQAQSAYSAPAQPAPQAQRVTQPAPQTSFSGFAPNPAGEETIIF